VDVGWHYTEIMQFEVVFFFGCLLGQKHNFLAEIAGEYPVFVVGPAGYMISSAGCEITVFTHKVSVTYYGTEMQGASKKGVNHPFIFLCAL